MDILINFKLSLENLNKESNISKEIIDKEKKEFEAKGQYDKDRKEFVQTLSNFFVLIFTA
jgi:hypothetical protein